MNVFCLILFILILIILIVVLPFKLKVALHINYLTMEVYYLVQFWFINLLCGKVNFDGDVLKIYNKDNLIIRGKGKKNSDNRVLLECLKHIDVVNVDFVKQFGNADDAMNTAIICSFENLVMNMINSKLKSKNKVMNKMKLVEPNFDEYENKSSIYAVIKISIFDVIISRKKVQTKQNKES